MTYNNQPAYNPVFANTNSVVVLGAVAREVDIKVSERGVKVARLTVAGEEIITDAEGKQRRMPFYEQGVFVGKRADKIEALGLQPGEAVLMDGKFKQRDVKDADGNERKQLEIDYANVSRALGFAEAERSKDAGGAIRLVGGFAKASVYGKVIGNGGELRYTQQGTPIFNFSVNARATWKQGDEWVSDAAFVRTTVWGPLGEELASLEVAKGMEAFIEGRPNRGSYEKDGRKVYTLDINATRVVISEGTGGGGGNGGGSASLDNLPDPFESFGGEEAEEELPF